MISYLILSIVVLNRVSIGSAEHLVPIFSAILLGIAIIHFSNRRVLQQQKENIFQLLGAFVSLAVVLFHLHKISLGGYNLSEDLPLFLCSFLALIIPVFTYFRKYWMYEILLFWIIAGTLQGVVTPDISEGFPSFDYFRYWIVHLGLLTIIIYATIVLKMRPTLKSVFKSFLTLQVYAVVVMGINYLLDANYSYLNRKPKSASALDYLGEWPYYLLVMEAILIPFFLLIYLPFYITKKKEILRN
ncbi:YwaF family protein [Bizionia myxarmorum]|uniref:TIGR02206 family membrane protein n=1 Tax=Bizionia myxarmorum TaxID=291186 RepID=A0A5D0RD31_9FLAO|nr:TIGR02206 family membrane protein [Bizionia myxarmorum]TYB79422.1 TIGR02206 family membrane protein [Bizionia myxarmorum]